MPEKGKEKQLRNAIHLFLTLSLNYALTPLIFFILMFQNSEIET